MPPRRETWVKIAMDRRQRKAKHRRRRAVVSAALSKLSVCDYAVEEEGGIGRGTDGRSKARKEGHSAAVQGR